MAGAGLSLGRLAVVDDAQLAIAAFSRAARQSDGWYAPQAADELAKLCRGTADTAENWMTVVQTDGYDGAADAAAHLGVLMFRAGRLEQARAAFEKAIVLRGTATAGLMINLGQLLAELDDLLGAREAFQTAARHGTPQERARADLELGHVLHRQGDRAEAMAAYERCAATGDPAVSSQASARIARIALLDEKFPAAEDAARAAIASRHPLAAPDAAGVLGAVLAQRSDIAGAQAAFAEASGSPEPVVAAEAQVNLAALLEAQGQRPEAERLLADVPVVGSDDLDGLVTFRLAEARLEQSGPQAAAALWRQRFGDRAAQVALQVARELSPQEGRKAVEHVLLLADPAILPAAVGLLVRLLDHHEAIARLHRAVADDDPELAPLAALSLGYVHLRNGDAAQAKAAWDLAAATVHPVHAPHAMYEIGVTLSQANRLVEARDWYRRVIAAGISPIQPYAAVNLGAVLYRLGDLREAEAALQVAINSDNKEQADKAWVNLGVLRKQAVDLDGARNAWLQALGGAPDSHRQAMINLRELRDELSGPPNP